ncbi:MAG TPA: M55 family metallopeptidase [Firmicutes bacterium]|nr:M55 family metallopeptidase [Bacillota bacterium]
MIVEVKMKLKIYIHTDLEGISGIDRAEIVKNDHPERNYCNERLMADLNAAIDGAFAGGATQVTVLDSHAGGGNFILPLLDKRADLDTRENKKWWGKLDESYCGTFFIGAHAMAGTINAFLDHTQSSKTWYNYWLNGRKMGELAQWAIVAANFNVPMLMVSGDEAACAEAREFFSPLETAAVKKGVGRARAILVDPDKATEMIREAAFKAMALVGKARPFKPILPMEIKLELKCTEYTDGLDQKPGVERLDGRTVRKLSYNYLDLFI